MNFNKDTIARSALKAQGPALLMPALIVAAACYQTRSGPECRPKKQEDASPEPKDSAGEADTVLTDTGSSFEPQEDTDVLRAGSFCVVRVDINSKTDAPDGKSWSSAFFDIKAAIDKAKEDSELSSEGRCEVWVKEGVYPIFDGQSPLSSLFVPSNVWLFGGFAGDETEREDRDFNDYPTVLEGAQQIYHVVTILAEIEGGIVQNVVFDGFTVRGGAALGDNLLTNSGGGMFLSDAIVMIRNTVFENNVAKKGGALAISQYLSVFGHVRIENSIFSNNSAEEGAVLYNPGEAKPYFVNSLFEGNNAGAGEGIISFSYGAQLPGFTNCTFAGNSGKNTKAVLFASEYEVWGRGGPVDYYLREGARHIVNSAFSSNDPEQLFPKGIEYKNVRLYYSVYPAHAVDRPKLSDLTKKTCIEGDVTFVDPKSKDFRLKAGSLGIDQGTNGDFELHYEIPEEDLSGKKRDSKPDMGAYEY